MIRLNNITFLFFLFLIGIICNAQSVKNPIISKKWDKAIPKELSNNRVKFRGALELSPKSHKRFGGLSSLLVFNNGNEILTVSDYSARSCFQDNAYRSKWYKMKIVYTKDNYLDTIIPLKEGQFANYKNELLTGEIESIALIDDVVYLSFDNEDKKGSQILSYNTRKLSNNQLTWKAEKEVFRIPEYPSNPKEGIETLTELDGHKLLAIHEVFPGLSESRERTRERASWKIDIKNPGKTKELVYNTHLDSNEVKGATRLPNGDILILEKHFDKNETTRLNIVYLSKNELQKSSLKGDKILDTKSNEYLDNFEGIAAFKRENKTYFLLISDSNGDCKDAVNNQHTLLFLFELL